MGRRGPAPTPIALKVLAGETRPSRIGRAPPEPRTPLSRPPAELSPAARAVWRRIVRELAATGILTEADADLLMVYCQAVVRYRQAARVLEESGPLVRGARRTEFVKSPLHQVVRDLGDTIRLVGRELGLSPAARVGLRDTRSTPGDPFESYLERGRPA